VAEDLDIHTILVPPYAGVLSAYGLLASDYRLFETRTHRIVIKDKAPALVRKTVAEMRNHIVERFRDIGLGDRDLSFNLTLEMRFVGQAFEVPVDIDAAALDRLSVEDLLSAFADAHHRVYFHGAANRNAVEVVSFRLGAVSPLEQVPALTEARNDGDATADRHRIFDGSLEVDCMLMRRAGLSPGHSLDGPAIVDDVTSTIFVPAGWRTEIDDHENLIMRRSGS
jgi:N-methylhydantoinase A